MDDGFTTGRPGSAPLAVAGSRTMMVSLALPALVLVGLGI